MNKINYNRTIRLLLLALTAAVAAPAAFAGGKCGDTDECLRSMRDSISQRGWLGIEYEEESERGLPEILKVMPSSPAAKGGLEEGDLLLSINGTSYAQPREEIYAEVKRALVPGNEVRLVVERDGEEVPLTIIAGHVPETVAAQWVGRHLLEYHLGDDDEDSHGQEAESEDEG